MGTCAAATTAGSPRPGRPRLLGAALGAALVLAGVTGLADRPGPQRAAPAAARPAPPVVRPLERAPSPPAPPTAGEAFEITRAGPALAAPAPACTVRRVPGAGGAAPDAVAVVGREALVAALVVACGAGWAFAPPAAGAPGAWSEP
jgi:hypothetical protein